MHLTGNNKNELAELPESTALDLQDGSVKVDLLVSTFLAAQSLKILPQAPFGDAVSQFVTKDDKHAMESFVSESLAGQVKQMLDLDSDEGEDLDAAMEEYRKKLEEQFVAGQLRFGTKRVLRPAPEDWDSDLDGHWELQPVAFEEVSQAPTTAVTGAVGRSAASRGAGAKPAPKGRGRTQRQRVDEDVMELDDDDEEEAEVIDEEEEEEQVFTTTRSRRAPAKKPAPKRTTTTTRKATTAAAKKPPARKTTTTTTTKSTRARKPALYLDDSDSDSNNNPDEVLSNQEEHTAPAPPTQRSQPTRRTTARTNNTTSTTSSSRAGTGAGGGGTSKRQTTLPFSQRNTSTGTGTGTLRAAGSRGISNRDTRMEVSADEISDDDGFEPVR
jgi:double-strand break repair protein MRE11